MRQSEASFFLHCFEPRRAGFGGPLSHGRGEHGISGQQLFFQTPGVHPGASSADSCSNQSLRNMI